jgi:hypothetical protein
MERDVGLDRTRQLRELLRERVAIRAIGRALCLDRAIDRRRTR